MLLQKYDRLTYWWRKKAPYALLSPCIQKKFYTVNMTKACAGDKNFENSSYNNEISSLTVKAVKKGSFSLMILKTSRSLWYEFM